MPVSHGDGTNVPLMKGVDACHLLDEGSAGRTRLSRYAWRFWAPVLPSKKPPVMQRSASARLSAAALQICSSMLPAVSSLSTSTYALRIQQAGSSLCSLSVSGPVMDGSSLHRSLQAIEAWWDIKV